MLNSAFKLLRHISILRTNASLVNSSIRQSSSTHTFSRAFTMSVKSQGELKEKTLVVGEYYLGRR